MCCIDDYVAHNVYFGQVHWACKEFSTNSIQGVGSRVIQTGHLTEKRLISINKPLEAKVRHSGHMFVRTVEFIFQIKEMPRVWLLIRACAWSTSGFTGLADRSLRYPDWNVWHPIFLFFSQRTKLVH